MEFLVRSTNSQYEQSDILERLDVRLLEIQAGDTGWDVFSLDYKVRLLNLLVQPCSPGVIVACIMVS